MEFRLAIVSLLLSICIIVPFARASSPFQPCNKRANYDVKVTELEISPNPVQSGQPATFTITSTTEQSISGGELVIEVSYFGLHVHTEKKKLCEETSCPVTTGPFVVSHSQTLPGFTPPGPYTLKMKMNDSEGNQLTCISFGFKIVFGSSVADM